MRTRIGKMPIDHPAEIAHFLVENTGSSIKKWEGHLLKEEQLILFGGYFFGRKMVHINGANETVYATWKVCFGTDYGMTREFRWSEFPHIYWRDADPTGKGRKSKNCPVP